MGCTASAHVAETAYLNRERSDNSVEKSPAVITKNGIGIDPIETLNGSAKPSPGSDEHAANCTCIDVGYIDDLDVDRSSILTVKSGNLENRQRGHTEVPRRRISVITPQSSPALNGVKLRVVDSPAPFRKTLNGTVASSPQRMRVRNGNPFSSPHAHRNPTPLLEQEECSDEEKELQSRTNPKKEDPNPNLLDKALLELSASLSESHGPGFQVELDSNRLKTSSTPSYKPDVTSIQKSSAGDTVVIDVGSGYCKAGFSQEDIPSVVIPTLVGRPTSIDASSSATVFVGNDVTLRSEVLSLSRPVQRGVVQNWDDWSALVDHVVNMELKVDLECFSSVVLPGSLFSHRNQREKQVEVMFENFHLKKLYLGSSPPMALHSFGMTSGLLVNVGHDITSCISVLHGNVQTNGMRSLNLGGYDVNRRLQTFIQDNHKETIKNYEKDEILAKSMMEKLCCVAATSEEARKSTSQKTYSLPNGHTISLGAERLLAPEILFNPSILGGDYDSQSGIGAMCVEAIRACQEVDGKETLSPLYNNVVLSGGGSLLAGMAQRLKHELSCLGMDDIKVHAFPKRQYASWRGAAHMTSLQLSRSRWMTKEEYEEHGAAMIHRKYV